MDKKAPQGTKWSEATPLPEIRHPLKKEAMEGSESLHPTTIETRAQIDTVLNKDPKTKWAEEVAKLRSALPVQLENNDKLGLFDETVAELDGKLAELAVELEELMPGLTLPQLPNRVNMLALALHGLRLGYKAGHDHPDRAEDAASKANAEKHQLLKHPALNKISPTNKKNIEDFLRKAVDAGLAVAQKYTLTLDGAGSGRPAALIRQEPAGESSDEELDQLRDRTNNLIRKLGEVVPAKKDVQLVTKGALESLVTLGIAAGRKAAEHGADPRELSDAADALVKKAMPFIKRLPWFGGSRKTVEQILRDAVAQGAERVAGDAPRSKGNGHARIDL